MSTQQPQIKKEGNSKFFIISKDSDDKNFSLFRAEEGLKLESSDSEENLPKSEI